MRLVAAALAALALAPAALTGGSGAWVAVTRWTRTDPPSHPANRSAGFHAEDSVAHTDALTTAVSDDQKT